MPQCRTSHRNPANPIRRKVRVPRSPNPSTHFESLCPRLFRTYSTRAGGDYIPTEYVSSLACFLGPPRCQSCLSSIDAFHIAVQSIRNQRSLPSIRTREAASRALAVLSSPPSAVFPFNPTTMNPKLRVAICGGGVGGLTCAVALSRYPDIHVEVYEAAQAFAEVGAGIGMWPRTWKIMERLGLADDLAKVSVIPPNSLPMVAFNMRKGDQPEGISFQQLITPGGMISFHRPEFQTVLLCHLSPSCRANNAKRLVSYVQTPSEVELHFADGATTTCDLLIGADGVKSTVRSILLRQEAVALSARGNDEEAQKTLAGIDPKWSGTSAYRATFPAHVLRSTLPGHRVLKEPMIYVGKNTELTAYPISRGRLINLAALKSDYNRENTTLNAPWVQNVPRAELLDDFNDWEPEVQALLQCIDTPSRWAVHTTPSLQSYISGNVALLGDAAHAMMPYQGAGAGQAMEDAYVLARLIGHPHTTRSTISRALEAYDAVRRPFSQRIAHVSHENGLLYTMNFPGLTFNAPVTEDSDGVAKLREIYARIRMNWEWAWETTVDGDVEVAVGMLES